MAMLENSDLKMSILFFFFCTLIGFSSSARVADKIYDDIQGDMACFKRFNGTHEIGCSSDYFGNVGVLYIPQNETDAENAITNGKHHPYILAVTPTLFTRKLLMTAKNSENVKGIVLLDSQLKQIESSASTTCPSHEYGLYNYSSGSKYSNYCPATESWNSAGNSLLYESFNFPIFLIQKEESIQAIKSCFKTYSSSDPSQLEWPLCAIQLHSNMFGTTNSEVCLRRKHNAVLAAANYCDEIHDYNIIAPLNPMVGELEDSSVIVIAARADAATMFDNISPGADAAVTGLVTLLAVAEALSSYKTEIAQSNKNIMFVLFEGEVWDYLGSTTMTYDMNAGKFPIKPSNSSDDSDQVSQFNFNNIDYFLELSQIGKQSGSKSNIYLYNDPISDDGIDEVNALNKKVREALISSGNIFNVSVTKPVDKNSESYPLPPSSVQSFLKYINISGTVMADHAGDYANRQYQSYMDDYKNVDYTSSSNATDESDKLHQHLGRIASTVASAVYKLTSNSDTPIEANYTLINELLLCFLRDVNCTLFREHAGDLLGYTGYFTQRPAKMYASVFRGEDILTNISLYLMGHFLGDAVNGTKEDCVSNSKSAIQKFFLPLVGENGTCIESTARLHSAISPAFTIPGYNFSSGEYPTWTESGWSVTKARLFLKPNPAEEVGLVVGGMLFIIFTLVISYWANEKADVLFERMPDPAFC